MNIKKLLLLLLFLFILNSFSAYAQLCGGSLFVSTTLGGPLLCPGQTGLFINASNIYLDCNGFAIAGNGAAGTSGVQFQHVNNITIRNCTIINFNYGIRGFNSTGSTLFNNILSLNTQGIFMTQMDLTTVDRNTVFNNTYGIYLSGVSVRNDIKNNDVKLNAQEGMYLTGSSDFNNFTGNNCSYNGYHGIHLNLIEHSTLVGNRFIQNGHSGQYNGFYASSQSHNTTLINNTAINNTYDGFKIATSQDSTVINNTAINNSWYGIDLHFLCLRGVVRDNTARNNKYYGIVVYGDRFNITNNLAEDNRIHSGFQLNNGYYNVAKNNIARNNNRDGFELSTRGNHTLINNTAYGNGDYGFHLQTSDYNILLNNTAYNNQKDGFYLYVSDHNNLTNNTARNNSRSGFFIYYYGCDNNNLIINKAFNNTQRGFYLDRADFNNLTDNKAIDNSLQGFYIRQSTDNIFTNNTVYFNSAGFELDTSSHRNKFFNNSVQGNTGSGFTLKNIQNTIARNNTIRNNGGWGIALSYCSASSFTKTRLINNSLDGLYIRSASTGTSANNNFTDFIVHDNAKNSSYAGVNIGGNSYNNRFINFSLINNSWGIFIQKIFTGLAFPNTPYGNLFANFTISNSATSLYVLNALNNTISGTYCPENVVFNETSYGMINYTQDINFTITTRFSDVIGFSNNMIHVNSSGAPYLNKSAILTFVNLSIAGDPQPIVDYNDSGVFNYCAPPTCVELLNNSLTTFVYNVTHFTNYSSTVIPFGNLTNASIIVPNASITVNNSDTFNVTCRVYCTGLRPCIGTNVTLDPLNPLTNLTDPTNAVNDVYADSQFIYAASEDSKTYIWNKTSLALYATIPSSAPLRTVWADSLYIYTGGTNNQMELWNRTDLVTPFANVVNISTNGSPYSIRSDTNYIYMGGGIGWSYGVVQVFNKTTFANVVNLTDTADTIRSIDIDANNLYAASHDSNVYVYNKSNFSQPPVVLGTCSFHDVKEVSQDANYIYAFSRDWSNACMLTWHKSNYSLKSNLSFTNTILLAGYSGNTSNFAYAGGLESTFWTNGSLFQINKSNFAVADAKNITNYYVKSLYCDASYLYAGLMDNGYSLGMVRLFNNSCGVIAPGRITIRSLTTVPSPVLVPLSAYCSANITFNGTRDTVYFNLTHPNGSSTRLSSTNIGTIYNSQNFTVSSMGTYRCTVYANDTNGSTASRSLSFSGGNKGAIPMNSGSPFYTTSQNPRYSSNQSCLNSTLPGNYCDTTWTVTVNGTPGSTWDFFCTYDNANGDLNSTRINVTIAGAPPPPPPPPRPSGGGGGGGATRAWQELQQEVEEEIEAECIESWICDDWSECDYSMQSRECIDINACGTTNRRPPTTRACEMPKLVEPPVIPEEKPKFDLEKVEVITPKSPSWNDLFNKREFLRGALLVIIVASLIYLGALAKHLKKSAKPVEKKQAIAAKPEPVPTQKKPAPAPKPVQKSPPKKPIPKIKADTPEDLLKELNKL